MKFIKYTNGFITWIEGPPRRKVWIRRSEDTGFWEAVEMNKFDNPITGLRGSGRSRRDAVLNLQRALEESRP